MHTTRHHYFGGTWIQSKGTAFISTNPATGELLWEGKEASIEDIDAAFNSASAASHAWSRLNIQNRIHYLEAFKERVSRRLTLLAEAISQETGKPYWEAAAEVNGLLTKVPLTIDAYYKRSGSRQTQQGDYSHYTRHHPHGVVAVFGPSNLPLHIAHGHILPALLSGNTVLFKPSEKTPLVASLITECWDQVNLPPGVFNLVQGSVETAQSIVKHKKLDGLFFSGNDKAGMQLSEFFGSMPQKILSLQMGGNNPLVVWDITDLTTSAYLTIQSAFLTSGQRGTNARRLIIPADQHGEIFIQTLMAMMKSIRVGPYFQRPEPFMGPVISHEAATHLLEKQQQLIDMGGKSLIEMRRTHEGTAFLLPGLIDMTYATNRLDEEIFGPLLQVYRVTSFQEAIKEANNTRFGLTASLFCPNPKLYEEFYQSIKCGIVNWNCPTTGASSAAPFGGIKHSGNHRPTAFTAVDYCAYPVSSMETETMRLPTYTLPGISVTYSSEQQFMI
ncbi:MAG: succinylglutamate-semialdehyde dehydrogenase [Parachlamydiales bacterium]|nr:succinylglutamate-semialdehyde dehydrogenase [Parachlamydiales bacterium]